jgi:hypothetical protein
VEPHPRVAERGDHPLGLRRRAVAGDDYLDVGIGLVEDRGDRDVAQELVPAVGRDHERDQRFRFGVGELVLLARPQRVETASLRRVLLLDVADHLARVRQLLAQGVELRRQLGA